jgi:hypothetical protein
MWKLWGTRWIHSHVHYVNYAYPVFINHLVIFVSWTSVFKWRNVINFQKRQAEGKRLVIIVSYTYVMLHIWWYAKSSLAFNFNCNSTMNYNSLITDLWSFSGQRSPKPLLNKKFYLDLKNHITSNNLEQKLKSLGAVSINLLFILVLSYVLGRETYRNCIRGKVDML